MRNGVWDDTSVIKRDRKVGILENLNYLELRTCFPELHNILSGTWLFFFFFFGPWLDL